MTNQAALRFGRFSVLLYWRAMLAAVILLLLLITVTAIVMQIGRYPLGLNDILAAFAGQKDEIVQMIVADHRAPRILTAIGAGAAFGLSGAMFQTMLRNPLASPDVIGFSTGASCGGLAAILLFGSAFILPGALLGGLLTAAAVISLSYHRGLQPYRLILIGLGVSMTLAAGADLLMSRIDVLTAADTAKWLVGTLHARNWSDVTLICAGLIVLAPIAIWLEFALSRIAMDDDIAHGLGLALSPLRLAVTATGVGLVALAVSVAGPLPFVAFISGPIARRLVKGARPALLQAALVGALVTLLADTAARSVPMVQLPAGVFTALIGAPVLMWLLVVQFNKGKF
ncbi:FecCD family ABC transporter permease [Loktanella agnita]|uniref:FecCD family ABC transporter permease n=1 Tax=Loktanella agnita TaxID=287097 RepID=UPI00398581CB